MNDYLIRLSWPHKDLQPHAKGHWAPKARATKAARDEAFWAAREAAVATDPMAILQFTFHPPSGPGGRPDVTNMPHRCKAAIDGIAEAMGCDDRDFQPIWPANLSEPVKGGCVLVHIKPSNGEKIVVRGEVA